MQISSTSLVFPSLPVPRRAVPYRAVPFHTAVCTPSCKTAVRPSRARGRSLAPFRSRSFPRPFLAAFCHYPRIREQAIRSKYWRGIINRANEIRNGIRACPPKKPTDLGRSGESCENSSSLFDVEFSLSRYRKKKRKDIFDPSKGFYLSRKSIRLGFAPSAYFRGQIINRKAERYKRVRLLCANEWICRRARAGSDYDARRKGNGATNVPRALGDSLSRRVELRTAGYVVAGK